MSLVFFWDPRIPTSVQPRLTRGEVKAVYDADDVRHLGSGAGGDSWLIERQGHCSVVKIPTSDYRLSWVAREIEGLKRGACERLVQVESVEQVTFSIGARVVITFEYINGQIVDQAIAQQRWPASSDVAEFLRGALEGLAVLHARNTVHRDIKPANIALRQSMWSEPVILDLGLARLLDEKSITRYPAALGTEEFMAPEIIEGARAQPSADLWSLGVVAHILLSHEHPFYDGYADRLNQWEALDRISRGPRPLPTEIPTFLERHVGRWLSPDPERRGSAAESLAEYPT